MKTRRTFLVVEITQTLKRAVVRKAKASNRNLSDYVRLLLAEHIGRNGNGTHPGGAQ